MLWDNKEFVLCRGIHNFTPGTGVTLPPSLSPRLLYIGSLGSPWYDYVYHRVVQKTMDRISIAIYSVLVSVSPWKWTWYRQRDKVDFITLFLITFNWLIVNNAWPHHCGIFYAKAVVLNLKTQYVNISDKGGYITTIAIRVYLWTHCSNFGPRPLSDCTGL